MIGRNNKNIISVLSILYLFSIIISIIPTFSDIKITVISWCSIRFVLITLWTIHYFGYHILEYYKGITYETGLYYHGILQILTSYILCISGILIAINGFQDYGFPEKAFIISYVLIPFELIHISILIKELNNEYNLIQRL